MVVCNTTPLSNLVHLEQIGILAYLFGEIHIPQAVKSELDAYFSDNALWCASLEADWLIVTSVDDRLLVRQFEASLHPGEAEALCLAIERNARLCLLDDRDARDLADENGLRTCGTIGLLIRAKTEGLIPSVRELLDTLRSEHYFWVADALYREGLRLAGEV